MGHFVYILKCANGMYYTGITWNIDKRIYEHNNGIKSSLQKSHLPVKLVYFEEKLDKIEAAKREKEIKGWSRIKKERLFKSLP